LKKIVAIIFLAALLRINLVVQASPIIRSFASGVNNQAIAIDRSGNIWTASPEQQTVTEVSPAGVILRSFTQLGAPNWKPGKWVGPFSIAADSAGNIWMTAVVFTRNENCPFNPFIFGCHQYIEVNAIRINPSGTVATFPILNSFTDEWIPQVIADNSGRIYISSSSDRLRTGVITQLDTMGITQQMVKVQSHLYRIALDRSGNIWGSNTMSDELYGISRSGAVLGPINTHHASTGIAVDQQGNFWVGGNAHEIEKISPSGEILVTTPIENNTGDGPRVIKIDGTGNVWAVNQSNAPNQGSSVVELNPQGAIVAIYPMAYATDLAIDQQGNVWVTNALPAGKNLYEIFGAAAGAR